MSRPAYVSALDLFTIGIGPSSSHTVGPMRAARDFAERLERHGVLERVDRVTVRLHGSLGATGVGHGTPDAVVRGLAGAHPESVDPGIVRGTWARLDDDPRVELLGCHPIVMRRDDVELAPRDILPGHPNALTLMAWDTGVVVNVETYYSTGGGFIRREGDATDETLAPPPHPFSTSAQLLAECAATGSSIADLAHANEVARHGSGYETRLDAIWAAMSGCVDAGLTAEGVLPGRLGVPRRAAALRARLERAGDRDTTLEWLHAEAMAVNEENAAGNRVVTAPTNGAAGIVPAVGRHLVRTVSGADSALLRIYLLTATAIGSLIKANASISGAEAGCQGEVGSACAMAAAGLCAALGGSPAQVENAAEIALEHHLGLTCDPVDGLVQIPCIERNAIASATAVSAARLALNGTGAHIVSLDVAIETMRQTGFDMLDKYKETAGGGLAVNVVEC